MSYRGLAITVTLLLWTAAATGQQTAPRADTVAPRRPPDVVFIPTPHDVVDAMLELARVRESDVVCDLGCGDGRVLVAAAKRYGCRAVGYDIDPLRIESARDNVRSNRVDKFVRIGQGDLFEADLSEASVVILYLTREYNQRLLPQLAQLKPGSRIVSHMFGIRGIKPEKVIQLVSREDGRKHALYLWTAPIEKKKPRASDFE
jgi:precorrin-6B methylase 2